MSLLTACDLADLQDAAVLVMGDTALISRATRTFDGAGGYNDAYSPAGSTPIQIVRVSGREQVVLAGEQTDQQIVALGKVPVGTGLLLRDRLTVGAQHFEVVAVLPDPTWAPSSTVALTVIP